MAALTRTQIRDLVRVTIGELDSYKLQDAAMNQFVNFGIRRVQQDLMGIGIKFFMKQYAFNDTHVTTLPTDIMSTNNAIINIKASTAVLAVTGPSVVGSVSGALEFRQLFKFAGGVSPQLSSTLGLGFSETAPNTFSFNIKCSGSNTVTQVATMLNASKLWTQYFTAVTATNGADTMDINFASIAVGSTSETLQTAVELSVEDFARVEGNTYLASSSTQPYYKRTTGIAGTQILEFLPKTINSGLIHYYGLLPDLTLDASTSGLPAEFEELLITVVAIKSLDTLKNQAEEQGKFQEYTQRITNLQSDYDMLLARHKQDRQELKTQNAKI